MNDLIGMSEVYQWLKIFLNDNFTIEDKLRSKISCENSTCAVKNMIYIIKKRRDMISKYK